MATPWEKRRAAAQGADIRTKPADPTIPFETRSAAANATIAESKAASLPTEAQLRQLEIDSRKLENQGKQLDIQIKQEDRVGKEKKDEDALRRSTLDSLVNQINRVDELYQQDLKGGLPQSVLGIPFAGMPVTDANRRFNKAGSQLLENAQAAFRIPGSGDQNAGELQFKLDAYLPRASNTDLENEEALNFLRQRTDAARQALGLPGATWLPDAEYRRQLQGLIASGDREAVQRFMAEQGAREDNPGDIDKALGGRAIVAPPTTVAPTDQGGLVAGARGLANGLLFNQAGELQGLGDTLGQAFHEGLPQGMSFKDLLSQNIARNEGILDADRQSHPIASPAGEVLGGFTGSVGALKAGASLLGRAAPRMMGGGGRAATARLATGEAGIGAAYGAGNPGDRGQNAAIGAGLGAAGSLIGQGAVGAVGRALSPNVSPTVQRLADQGIVMSSAQRSAANGGVIGRARKRVEDAMTTTPGLGDAITSQRGRQFNQYNRAVVNDALQDIRAKAPRELEGNKLVEWAQDRVSDAYDEALPGIRAPIDQGFLDGNAAVRASVEGLPQAQREMFNTIYDRAVKPFVPEDGVLTGKALQDIKRGLDKQIMRLDRTQNPADEYLSDELQSLRSVFFDWAGRAAPEKVQAFRNANSAFANMVRVNRAAAASKADGVWSPNQMLGAIKAESGNAQSARGQLPMQQLSQDAAQILPSQLPTSGSIERLMVNGGGLAAAGGGLAAGINPAALGIYGGLAARHLPGVDSALQAAALNRPMALESLGEVAKRNRRIGGMFAAPLALQYSAVD